MNALSRLSGWVLAALVSGGVILAQEAARNFLPPTPVPGLAYTNDFFPGATYRPEVPTQARVIGFGAGERAASPEEIEQCLKAWTTAARDRSKLVEYARSHENRPLHYVVVTAPKNLARLPEIQTGLGKLADPRKTTAAESKQLIDTLPAVAWLAYTIHGDETEGSDAALAMLYHLLASRDAQVGKLLEDLVIIVDPLMNPDGRGRFIKMIAEQRGAAVNIDDQALVHSGYWPQGRGNHYLFDLNRDWILGVHPESRGRIREVGRWNPQLFVDAHGMGPQATHLFSPPREPINPNIPKERATWGELFARDQAQAFDRWKLAYYTGEWHEEWYPGYSDAYTSYRGAIGILYEQARIAEDGVRRPGGRILSYRESVHHHVIGNLANLATLQGNARALREHLYRQRQAALDANGSYAKRTFALLPTANDSRRRDLLALLQLEGIEVYEAAAAFTAPVATNQLGRVLKDQTVPAGTLLIPNRQPLGHLIAGMLEFDPRFPAPVLAEERRELLLKGQSRIYDTTAWNLTMFYGLEALTLAMEMPDTAKLCPPATNAPAAPAPAGDTKNAVAWVLSGADDLSLTAAARLMEAGVQVRVAEKDFRLDNQDFSRGSIVITALDNRHIANAAQTVQAQAAALGLRVAAVTTGLGAGVLPDLGGGHFERLEPPRVALAGREGFSSTDYGAIWLALDRHLGVRHSHLGRLEGADLSRYNVLILPDSRGELSSNVLASLKTWIRAGGTLIAIGSSTGGLINERADFSRVRALPDALGRLPEYEAAIFREWQWRTGQMPASEAIWAHQATPTATFPWQLADGPHLDEKELKRRDAWQALFMPQGAFLAARTDTNHWLTAGCGDWLPVLVGRQHVLMAADGVEAPIRYGVWEKASAAAAPTTPAPEEMEKDAAKGKKEIPRTGWCALPPRTDLRLRLSGLVWPEATHRLAHGAWVTRESLGRGQVILFASNPAFRGTARGMTRVFLNAVVCGPGCGAAAVVQP